MDIDELRAFVLVVENGSFSGAAKREAVARTTLRRKVDALEASVGKPLMHRGSGGVVLTSAGQRLFEEGRALQRQAEELLQRAREADEPEAVGVVRAVVPHGGPDALHLDALSVFKAQWPQLRHHVRFAEAPTRSIRGDTEVVVWMGSQDLDPEWEVLHEARIQCRLLAGRRYLAAKAAPSGPDDLDGHEILDWTNEQWPAGHWPTRRSEPWPVTAAFTTGHFELLYGFVRRGQGLAVLPIFDAERLQRDDVQIVLDDVFGAELRVRAAARVGSMTYARFKAVVQALPQTLPRS